MNHWQNVMKAIKDADVILFILDARMPELSRNRDLETKLQESGKEILTVFNKVDLVSRERLIKLKKENENAFFISVPDKAGINALRTHVLILAKKSETKLNVGIVGYPNVGKSAITNILSRTSKTKVSSKAGTTIGIQWASSSKFKILDSPGVIPLEDDEIKLGVLGAKNPEKIKNPRKVASEIIKLFLDNNPSKLEKEYGFKIESTDEYEILLQIGQAKKLLRKGGLVDEQRTFLMTIRDWQKGKLKL